MKSLNAALILGLFVSGLCFAQTQTGNASYNESKKGLTISHPSISFGARVRITNLRNNQEVIATVDGRIPVSDPRIADISAEAGKAIGMSGRGYTEVRIEHLVPVPAASEDNAAIAAAGKTEKDPPPSGGSVPPPAPPAPVSVREEARSEAGPVQPAPVFFPYPAALGPSCCLSPSPCPAILILLILAVLLLAAILILLLVIYRTSWRFRIYSRWAHRHFSYSRQNKHYG
jgi:hypothetical protein